MNDILETSRRLHELGLHRATLLVDRRRAEANIARFTDRADAANTQLRPHFKTHQSADVAGWFRAAGVTRATVSSLGQAAYFADHGWSDLTLAISANPLEIAGYSDLASRIELGLLVDNSETVARLAAGLGSGVRIWLEIDVNDGRTGIPWNHTRRLVDLAEQVTDADNLELVGLLTHAGQTYGAADRGEAAAVFHATREHLQSCRDELTRAGFGGLLISAGDTPGFAAVTDWTGLDEARPGNFVFHDLMQLVAGACTEKDLACAVACPVVGVYPERGEAVVHGGAIHLSTERLTDLHGDCFGCLMGLKEGGFGGLLADWSLTKLTQEHGVVTARGAAATDELRQLRPGDLMLVAPVHSCLTCEQFASYRTLAGDILFRHQRS